MEGFLDYAISLEVRGFSIQKDNETEEQIKYDIQQLKEKPVVTYTTTEGELKNISIHLMPFSHSFWKDSSVVRG